MERRPAAARIAAALALALGLGLAGCAAPREQGAEAQAAARSLMHDAALAVQTVVDDGDRPELRTALRGACAALVFPHMRGAGFLAGWAAGAGVLTVRDPASGHWLGPAFFTLGDMSIGPEVALATWQLIVVFEQCDALVPLEEGSNTFSFRTSFARRSAEHGGGLAVKPGIRAFVRTEGAVVGVSLHFVEVRSDGRLTAACHGRDLTTAQALAPGAADNENVAAFRRAMEYAAR